MSVGIYEGEPVLDLPYIEDRDASVDFNVVMTGKGEFVDVRHLAFDGVAVTVVVPTLNRLPEAGL